jgi:hypothetical protein
MHRIETKATVTPDGVLTVQLPPDVPPGEHQVVITIDERPLVENNRPPLDFPVNNYGPWPEGFTVRREEIYGDDGR